MDGQDHRFDFTKQLARFGDDFRQLSRFARHFSEEAPRRIKLIRLGLVDRDPAAISEAAEALRDLLEMLGAPETAAIADGLIRCSHDRDFVRARLLVIALQGDVDELLGAVRTWPPLAA